MFKEQRRKRCWRHQGIARTIKQWACQHKSTSGTCQHSEVTQNQETKQIKGWGSSRAPARTPCGRQRHSALLSCLCTSTPLPPHVPLFLHTPVRCPPCLVLFPCPIYLGAHPFSPIISPWLLSYIEGSFNRKAIHFKNMVFNSLLSNSNN